MVELEQNVRYQHQTWIQERRNRGWMFGFFDVVTGHRISTQNHSPFKTSSLNFNGLGACLTL